MTLRPLHDCGEMAGPNEVRLCLIHLMPLFNRQQ